MIGEIKKHLQENVFIPFMIHMADGRGVHIPTRDHIALSPAKANVTHDNDSWDLLPSLRMTGLTVDLPAPQPRQS